MELVNFMNQHEDWQTLLAAEPYFLNIKKEDVNDQDYYIIKYDMINSDMGLAIVQEARGSIFRYDSQTNLWKCVCFPFRKFFNYGEKYSAVSQMDWESTVVQQKVDGSLIKLWYDDDYWFISTNGTINAFVAECGDTTFGALVTSVINKIPNFWDTLDTDYCYMFELTSPFNHIVINYEGTNLWYLGRRNMITEQEDDVSFNVEGILHPSIFPHKSLAECVAAAHGMGDDEEGYVCCDANFYRIKVKGDEYLKLHKIRGNGPLTTLRVVQMWQDESLDDFVAYYPEFSNFVNEIVNTIKMFNQLSEMAYTQVKGIVGNGPRYEFARYANTYKPIIRSYLYARLDEKVLDAITYLKNMRPRALAQHIILENGKKEIGITEDE